MNKPTDVAEADILACIGSLTNLAYSESTHTGIEYEVYDASRVDLASVQALECVAGVVPQEKSVVITLRPEYRNSIYIPQRRLPEVNRRFLLILVAVFALVVIAVLWMVLF